LLNFGCYNVNLISFNREYGIYLWLEGHYYRKTQSLPGKALAPSRPYLSTIRRSMRWSFKCCLYSTQLIAYDGFIMCLYIWTLTGLARKRSLLYVFFKKSLLSYKTFVLCTLLKLFLYAIYRRNELFSQSSEILEMFYYCL
jgi:hypothetical protein